MTVPVNDPVVLAELTALHEAYEKALMENDAGALDGFFWDSPDAVRFGVTENLHGADEIRKFRNGRSKINLAREIRRLDVVALGDAAGIVNLEFVRRVDGAERHGRQTQFWFRFEQGWRIVSAHVSFLASHTAPGDDYLAAAAHEIGLTIDESNRAAVREDLRRIAAVAAFLMEFPLSQTVEAAPVFRP